MGKFREETFIRIRNDFNEHKPKGRGPFLYQYLAEGKCSEAYRKETDPGKADDPSTENAARPPKEKWSAEFDPEPYQDLFERLNRKRNTKAFVPVRVDQETGTGFYIVGKDHYVEFPYDKKMNLTCGIGILTDWVSDYDAEPEEREADIHLSLTIGSLEDPMDFPNIAEANSWFINRLYRDERERFGFFRECNGRMPQGADERFDKYFTHHGGAQDWFEELTEADREDAMKEYLA